MRAALEGLPGVASVRVDLDTGSATVFSSRDLNAREAAAAVRGKVLFSWARGVLARLPLAGRERPS